MLIFEDSVFVSVVISILHVGKFLHREETKSERREKKEVIEKTSFD